VPPLNDDPPWEASRYPRTARYLAQLPAGLASFPECEAKGSVVRKVHEFSRMPLAGLPRPLQHQLDAPESATTWVPQCHTLALILAMVESRGLAGAQESAWIREAATHLFSSPMYQILMWAATPRMVFKAANVRWRAFFRGNTLTSHVEAREATVYLDAPTGLFNHDLALVFVDVIHAAVNYTRDDAGSARVALSRFEPGIIEYAGAW
jgi:hypothetical protein